MGSTCRGPEITRRWRTLVTALLVAMALMWNPVAIEATALEWVQRDVDEIKGEILAKAFVPLAGITFGLATYESLEVELDKALSRSSAVRSYIVTRSGEVDPVYGIVAPLGGNPDNSTFGMAIGLGPEVTVAGYSDTDLGPFRAIKWTLSGGTIDLGTLPGNPPRAPGATQDLPPTSQAFGISEDAAVIVGLSTSATSIQTAFRWTASDGTMRDLGALNGVGGRSVAFAANGDGTVVVGQSEIAGNAPFSFPMHAFRWVLTPGTASGVMTDLDPSDQPSVATMVTADGSVVVGAAGHLGVAQAFRWTQATGLVPLGVLPGQAQSAATGVSGDGSIVVGLSGSSFSSNLPNGLNGLAGEMDTRAFRWTQATGLQDLNSLLSAAGIDMTGVTLISATAITRDGQFITGNGVFPGTPAGETTVYLARYCEGGSCASLSAGPRFHGGDFNGDGKTDILWRQTSGALYTWFINGTTIASAGSPGGIGNDWVIEGVGDFNGDGKADILWRHTSGSVYVWLLNGTSVIGQGSPGAVGTDWAVVGVGDFNGDGKADILWRHASGSVYEWLLNGTSVIGQGFPGGAGNDWQIQ